MENMTAHGMPLIEEEDASPEVVEVYAALKQLQQRPTVPNWAKILAVSPSALKMYTGMLVAFYEHLSLPQSLVAMICFTIAERSNCTYCAALNEHTCRTLGVDEETVTAMATDLEGVNPERVRAIIEFSLKIAKESQGLSLEDFDKLRAHGVSNDEIMEIALIAGMGVLNDVLADAVKMEVDPDIAEALGK